MGATGAAAANDMRILDRMTRNKEWDIENKRAEERAARDVESHAMQKEVHARNIAADEQANKDAILVQLNDYTHGLKGAEKEAAVKNVLSGNDLGRRALLQHYAPNIHPDAVDIDFVTLDGNKYVEFIKKDGTRALMTQNRSTDPNDRGVAISESDFIKSVIPTLDALSSSKIESPALIAHLRNTAVETSSSAVPSITETGAGYAQVVDSYGQGRADAAFLGDTYRDMTSAGKTPSPEESREFQAAQERDPEAFGSGILGLFAEGVKRGYGDQDRSQSSPTALPDETPDGERNSFVAGAMVGNAAKHIASGANKLIAGITGQDSPANNAPNPKLDSDLPAKPKAEVDPQQVVNDTVQGFNDPDKGPARLRIAEQRTFRTAGPKQTDPVERAKTAAFLVHRKYISGTEGVRYTQVGFLDQASMAMANYPEEVKLRQMEAQANYLDARARASAEDRKDIDASARRAHTMVMDGIKQAYGKNYAGNSMAADDARAITDAFKHYGIAQSVGENGQPFYDPRTFERQMLENPGIVSSIAGTMDMLRKVKNGDQLTPSTLAALALSTNMRGVKVDERNAETLAAVAYLLPKSASMDPTYMQFSAAALDYSISMGRPLNAQQLVGMSTKMAQAYKQLRTRDQMSVDDAFDVLQEAAFAEVHGKKGL
jgi:hypothetical protein